MKRIWPILSLIVIASFVLMGFGPGPEFKPVEPYLVVDHGGSGVTFSVGTEYFASLEKLSVTFCPQTGYSKTFHFPFNKYFSKDLGTPIMVARGTYETIEYRWVWVCDHRGKHCHWELKPFKVHVSLFAKGNCAREYIPMMWLLTKGGDKFDPKIGNFPCIIISETAPSIPRQNALCFVGTYWDDLRKKNPDWTALATPWTADNAPCAGPVWASNYATDTRGVWACDDVMLEFNGARLDLFAPGGGYQKSPPNLYAVYIEHLKHIGQ